MMKILHLSFVILAVSGFIVRVILSETHPRILKLKTVKIAPHVIDTLLLISGLILVFQGNWLSMRYGWIIAKLAGLFGYIGFGVIAMRQRGLMKWLALAAALACLAYIGRVAVTKQIGFF
ncbi:MAG: SirB2 family protein [Methylosarcina sp.]